MKHPPITQGLDQAAHLSSDAWEAFFEQCREVAVLARQRRKAKAEGQALEMSAPVQDNEAAA